MKKFGFTLAELLIAFGVLGVVAVLAIPTFVQAQQDKEVAAKLSLAQSVLSNATEMGELNNGKLTDSTLATLSEKDIFNTYYKKTLKLNTFCSEDSSETCWTPTSDFFGKTKASGGDTFGITGTVHTGFVLQDGMNVTMTKVKGLDEKFGIETKDEYSLVFMVDINGAKEPNTIGKDVFAFVKESQGRIIPAGKHNDSFNCRKGCDLDDDYWDCSAKVLLDGKRSYM